MLRSAVLAVCLVLALPCLPAQTLHIDAVSKAVDAAAAQGTFSGVVIVAQGRKVLLSKAVGSADRAARRPMRVDTVFRLACSRSN